MWIIITLLMVAAPLGALAAPVVFVGWAAATAWWPAVVSRSLTDLCLPRRRRRRARLLLTTAGIAANLAVGVAWVTGAAIVASLLL